MSSPSGGVTRSRSPHRQSRLIDLVRLIFVILGAPAGFYIAQSFGSADSTSNAIGIVLGASVGFLIGGAFGRLTVKTVTSAEEEFRRRPASEIVVGVAGIIVGLMLAFLGTFPLVFSELPPLAKWPAAIFIYAVCVTIGYGVASAKSAEIYAVLGLKPKAVGISSGEVNIIDTSALIDGRILDLVDTGFMTGTMLVHSGVLRELQSIADSSDDGRRKRGRRGLDVLTRLQKSPQADVVIVDEDDMGDVDAALVRLAKDRGGTLVTVDSNLAKVAEAVRVPVRSVNALASAFRVPLAVGEHLGIQLVKEGKEHGQAVGYLDDGTMVVVQDGAGEIGSEVSVRVTNTLQTPTGRMIFAALDDTKS